MGIRWTAPKNAIRSVTHRRNRECPLLEVAPIEDGPRGAKNRVGLKILFISNLFPDSSEPVRGLDNATVLHWLAKDHGAEIRVISPRPTLRLPLTTPNLRQTVPGDATFDPIYPEVGFVPKFGTRWNDRLLKRGINEDFQRLVAEFEPEIVLCSWLFPDGCAVAELCRQRGIPLVLVTQGSDTHQYLQVPLRRLKILRAINASDAVICRSADLGKRLKKAGAPGHKLHTIYNGIDPSVFFPGDRCQARRDLGLGDHSSPLLLFVGNFLPVKNPEFLLEAHAALNQKRKAENLPETQLVMIGDGPMKSKLEQFSINLGTRQDLRFLGRQTSFTVSQWMRAADLLCLSSVNEGFPNVILEAMASNLPVISTRVGGIEEKITEPELGRLVEPDDLDGYVEALESMLSQFVGSEPALPRTDLSWESTARSYQSLLKSFCRDKSQQ